MSRRRMSNNDSEKSGKANNGNWERDPYHRHEHRWWSGNRWSEKVRSNDETQIDPPGVIPKPVGTGTLTGPAEPIIDSPSPISQISRYVPHLLLVGLLLFLGTLTLALISIFA